jgi:CHAT domain-containing protein
MLVMSMLAEESLYKADLRSIAATHYNLGLVYMNLGMKDAAVFCLKIAVNTFQSVGVNIAAVDKDVQKYYIQSIENCYHSLANILIEQGRIYETQQVLAMIKEEEYFDFIRRDVQDDTRSTTVSYTPHEVELVDRYSKIAKQLFTLSEEKRKLLEKKKTIRESEWNSSRDKKRFEEIDSLLKSLTKELHTIFDRLETSLKIVTADRGATVGIDFLNDIQKTLKSMGRGAALVHTLIAPEHVWLILTTPDNQIHVKKNIQQKELFEQIKTFRECLDRPTRNPELLPAAKRLYDVLIAPISEELRKSGTETLLFYLDGALRYIPISALHDGKEWLAEKYTVVVYTDAAREKLKDARGVSVKTWEAAAMGVTKAHPGFSALPSVKDELESIIRNDNAKGGNKGVIPGIILIDTDFTERAFAGALNKNTPLIHVASHFKLEPGNISNSYLLLGDGEHLTLEKLRRGNFKFEKVDQLTLSACNTAIELGEGAGREMEGLGVLAQKKGAKSVMATLWPIADKSTGIFMPRYYELLQQKGMTRAEALRQTQVEFINGKQSLDDASPLRGGRDGRGRPASSVTQSDSSSVNFPGFSHPFYWAPFILMGNWM